MLNAGLMGRRRNLTMPGVSATVSDQIEALRDVAGDKVVALIRREPDETVHRVVSGWARDFEASLARDMGFQAETSFQEIIQVYVEDEPGGKVPI